MSYLLPSSKLKIFQRRIATMLKRTREGKTATLKERQSIVGTLGSMTDCVAAVRLRLNALMATQNQARLSGKTLFSEEATKELSWWRNNLAKWNGRSIIPRGVDLTMDVDASNMGLGAIFQGEGKEERAHRFFMEGDPTHINHRELLAAEYGLRAFTKKLGWKEKSIRIRTDSAVAMAYLNKMGGRVRELSRVAERIHNFAFRHQLVVSAEWIPSAENLADEESRLEGSFTDRMLNPKVFELIQRRFGKLTVDLFATGDNTQTQTYVSLKADPGAWYVDTFSRPIPAKVGVYANPPFILIPKLLATVKREKAQLVLVAPVWPSQPWWPLLMGMVINPPPLSLPRSKNLYLPPRGPLSQMPGLPPNWETIACHVSARDSAKMDSRQEFTI
jgi:hypothetical protein